MQGSFSELEDFYFTFLNIVDLQKPFNVGEKLIGSQDSKL
jgi:hypothetical protein